MGFGPFLPLILGVLAVTAVAAMVGEAGREDGRGEQGAGGQGQAEDVVLPVPAQHEQLVFDGPPDHHRDHRGRGDLIRALRKEATARTAAAAAGVEQALKKGDPSLPEVQADHAVVGDDVAEYHGRADPVHPLSVDVVVARFTEDISWINDHCLDDLNGREPAMFYVYNKGEPLNATRLAAMCGGRVVERRVPNVGLEASAFVRHVLEGYDGRTADLTVLVHGHEPVVGWAMSRHHTRDRGGHLFPGVQLSDYVTHGPMWVPTEMWTRDERLMTFRKGYLTDTDYTPVQDVVFTKNTTHDSPTKNSNGDLRDDRKWTHCAERGAGSM